MIQGHVRDRLPRVLLSLPGEDGPFDVEFILDTGFEGELALPRAIAAPLIAEPAENVNGNPTTYHGLPLAFDIENRLLNYNNTLLADYTGEGLRAWKETSAGRTYFVGTARCSTTTRTSVERQA